MLSISDHGENANQNHNTCQNGYFQKEKEKKKKKREKKQVLVRM